jgi:hypothetical protein
MTYATVEAAVETLIVAMTEFTAETVSRGDYRILDEGADDLCVLVPGSFDQDGAGQAGARKSIRAWAVLADLFRRYLDDATTWADFVATRDALIDHLEQYPTLNGVAGLTLVALGSDADPTEVFDEDENGPFFVFQRIRIAVTERVDLTGGEYTT